MSTTSTLVKPVDEAIEIVENQREIAHAVSLEASQEVKAVAQRRVSGYSNEVIILGDISQMSWAPEHSYSLADERSWVLTFDGDKPLKKGYELIVRLEECEGWELNAVSEKRPVNFQMRSFESNHDNIAVMHLLKNHDPVVKSITYIDDVGFIALVVTK